MKSTMFKVLAIMVSGGASLGASTLVASPWGVAAAHRAKVERVAAEQHVSVGEVLSQGLDAYNDEEASVAQR